MKFGKHFIDEHLIKSYELIGVTFEDTISRNKKLERCARFI